MDRTRPIGARSKPKNNEHKAIRSVDMNMKSAPEPGLGTMATHKVKGTTRRPHIKIAMPATNAIIETIPGGLCFPFVSSLFISQPL
jgi:hypothetical protein